MDGKDPTVQFSQHGTRTSFWANRTGLKLFDNQQLEAIYSKAREFFLERGSKLIADHGWQEDATDMTAILNLSKPECPHLLLPASFASFLEASEANKWSKMFHLFKAKLDFTNDNLFIDTPIPLSDIFYLLQTLLPGMLLIYHTEEIGEFDEEERTRALPPASWVEDHKELLQTIFEDHQERYDCLLATAADSGLAEKVTFSNDESCYDDDDDFDPTPFRYETWNSDYDLYHGSYMGGFGQSEPDFTACDKECGYCGRCDY